MAIPLTLSDVPNLTPYIQYVATASQTVFPYPFPITQDSDLVCVANGVTLPTDSGYTLSGQGHDTGGNLTFTIGRTAGDIITLYRDIPIARITQIGQNSGFSSTAFNAEFNNLYLIAQQLEAQIAQCLQLPITNSPPPITTLTKASYAGMYLSFDSNGNPQPAALTTSGSVTSSLINSLMNLTIVQTIAALWNPQTAAELAATVTPTNYLFVAGNLRRYGADPTGVADSTTAITNALLCSAGSSIYAPAGTYKCTAQIEIFGNTLFYGDGMGVTTFSFNNPSNNQFIIGGNKATVRDFTISVTGVGVASQVAAINVSASDYCQISRIEVIGASWAGVGIFLTSSHNIVEECYFHGFQGALQDSADITLSYLSGNTDYNIIRNNYCNGGNETGIHMLGDTNVSPAYNLVTGNRIGQHTTYGILDYRNSNGLDCFNQIVDNYIENIQGTTRMGASGAGIYIAGAGGDLIQGNVIRNCCVQTTTRSLVPAAIGVIIVNCARVTISDNVIEGMTEWDGICIASCVNSGANIVGNTIRMPANTTGAAAINIAGSSNVVCDANSIDISPITGTTVDGIDINLTANQTNIVVSDNRITGGNNRGIFVTGASSLTGALFSGNILSGAGGGNNGLDLSNLVGASVTGNYVNLPTSKALNIATCTQTRFTNNVLITSGATAVISSGPCTGSYYDISNYQNTAIDNAATGLICHQLLSAVPSSGSFHAAVGDHWVQTTPTASNPPGGYCVTAGAPGTWKNEANLSA